MVVERGVAGRAGAMRAIAPSISLKACSRKGHWRPTPRFYVAGAGGVATVEICVSTAAKLRPSTRTRQRYIASRVSLPLYR